MALKNYNRNHEAETDKTPYQWIDRSWGAGVNAHMRVWVGRDVPGHELKRWTVRKEEVDDSGKGQQKPTDLSTHTSKNSARQAAVQWMKEH